MIAKKIKEDCLFCQIIQGKIPAQIVHQDNQILVFKDIAPKASVHLLVIPKYHIENLNDLDVLDSDFIVHAMTELKKIAKKQNLKGFRIIINSGKQGGQEVFHLHFHLLGGQMAPFSKLGNK